MTASIYPRARRRALVVACANALASGAAAGETPPSDADARANIRIEVTGSHIRRTDADTALPLQILTREDIERGDFRTAAEVLAHVAANFNGRNDLVSIGEGGRPGLASANLRGMGEGNTLVLLNGRRIANYAFSFQGAATVDLNSIPLAAIERVEILRDGASSIYGTDAISGVVNFITRDDFRGVEATGEAGVAEHHGGDRYRATVSAGTGDLGNDRYNAFVTLDWQKERPIDARNRPYAKTGYLPGEGVNRLTQGGTVPANVLLPGFRFGNPAFATGCAPPASLPFVDPRGEVCAFDFAAVSQIAPETERQTLLARATWHAAPQHQLFAEYAFAKNTLTSAISPTPVLGGFSNPVLYPSSGPYYPTAFAADHGLTGDIGVLYRALSLGPRVTESETEAHRILAGAKGTLLGWEYDAAIARSWNTGTYSLGSGWLSGERFREAFATGLINPFGPSGEQGTQLERAAQVSGPIRQAKATTSLVDSRASRDVLALPGGPLAIALGGEARREKLSDRPEPMLETGDIAGAGGALKPQDAGRTVYAAFIEANIPVVKGVEVQLSARHDHYSDFGGTTNPKIALRWQPTRSLLVRGSWGTGFRAPSLPELYTAQQVNQVLGDEQVYDPVRCPITNLISDCLGPFNVIDGGNPVLQPERSTQYTAGVVWAPTERVSLALDYWNIDKKNVIGTLDEFVIFDNYARYGASNVVRGPVDPAYPNLPGPVDYLIVYNENLGRLKTSGLDIGVQFRSDATSFGRFAFKLDGTYIADWKLAFEGLPSVSDAGRIGTFGPVPRWRHYATLNWDYGAWSATLAQTYQSGYSETDPKPCDPEIQECSGTRRVGSYSIWDLQTRYTGFRNTTIAVGIRNLFDRDPPFAAQGTSFQVGFDPLYADPRGRLYYARLTYAFK